MAKNEGLRFMNGSLLGFHRRLSVCLNEDCHLLLFAIYLELGRGGVSEWRSIAEQYFSEDGYIGADAANKCQEMLNSQSFYDNHICTRPRQSGSHGTGRGQRERPGWKIFLHLQKLLQHSLFALPCQSLAQEFKM